LSDGEHYFGDQFTLSMLPSATTLKYLQENAHIAQEASRESALIFGNPTTELPPLAYAVSEAQVIGTLFKTAVHTSAEASEAQLWDSVQNVGVLHLAAHGEYNEANALYSAIVLAPGGEHDGRLETWEIFGLPLKGTDLVTLSACQTSVGDLSRGDELVGLTRAFFFAGTPTVISSLWQVDDAATETLMIAFYRHWKKEGMSKAEALQAAQADVRANPRWASPFYWAGFVLNGHPGERR
jgi:CHAT domain-containing protein